MKCVKCGQDYGVDDDVEMCERITSKDPEWLPEDGKCYGCYLQFLYSIYGGWLEPCFVMSGVRYMESGPIDENPEVDVEKLLKEMP